MTRRGAKEEEPMPCRRMKGSLKVKRSEGLSALLGRWSDSRKEVGAEIVTEGILFLSMTNVIEKFRREC